MRVNLITGSAGFIGTNLTKHLLEQGEAVIGIDNFSSSEEWKARIFKDNEEYEFFQHDIVKPLDEILNESEILGRYGKIDRIFNLACPASPPRYINISLETIDVCTIGVRNMLEIATKYDAVMLQASTSEVYGDPLVHPQVEDYRGNVNTVGPRSCYDEGKRMGETICYEYHRLFNTKIKIVRIFNTYGPYMDPNDGRVITNFIRQALDGKNLTIYEEGKQTRSFQYIDNLIDGFLRYMETEDSFIGPMNLGNPNEFTIKQLADLVLEKIQSNSQLEMIKMDPNDPYDKRNDPQQRRPDISLAQAKLGWDSDIPLTEGLDKTIEYYKNYPMLRLADIQSDTVPVVARGVLVG
jgi:UDP-glucuronate decarboxylase